MYTIEYAIRRNTRKHSTLILYHQINGIFETESNKSALSDFGVQMRLIIVIHTHTANEFLLKSEH